MQRIKASSLNRGLVGAWCPSVAGDGFTLPDLSGYGNHGTLTNMDASDWVGTDRGRALDFDGVDDYVTPATRAGIPISGDVSLSLWVRTPNVNPSSNVSMFGHGGFGGWKLLFFPNNSSVRVNCNGVANFDTAWSVLSGLNNTFFHIAITYGNGTWRLYVKGLQVSSQSMSAYITVASNFCEIGRTSLGAEAGQMVGQQDDIRMYNRALSPSEIKQLYEGGPGFGLRLERKRTRFQVQGFNVCRFRRQQLIGTGVY